MKRGFLVLMIVAIVVGLVLVIKAGNGRNSNSQTKNGSSISNKQDSNALLPQKLKVIIMPAADIIEQVRDVARAVATGDTKPSLALAIYSKADEYLTDTRVKIDEVNLTGKARQIKVKSDKIIKESVKNVDNLKYLTKISNKDKLEKVAVELDSHLAELRRLFKTAPESKK